MLTQQHAIEAPLLAPDPAIPYRDLLLDAGATAAHLGGLLGADIGVDDVSLVRAKYRIGESLRVSYSVDLGGIAQRCTARVFQRGESARAHRKALRDVACAPGGRPGVLHDPDADAVWWLFPNDRRLRDIDRVSGAHPTLAG